MSETTTVTRLQKVTITQETAYGVSPDAEDRLTGRMREPKGLTIKLTQTQVENMGQSTRFYDKKKHIKGLRKWEADGEIDVRPENVILNAAATPTTSWLSDMLEVFFGGAHSGVGSTVLSAAGATGFTVQDGDGIHFNVGSPVAIVMSGVKHFRTIKSITGDAIVVHPNLPGTPAADQLVHNCYSNWFTDTVSKTLELTATHVQTSADQYVLNNGIVSEFTLVVDRDKTVSATVKFAGRKYDGPKAKSLDVTPIVDVLRNPIHTGAATFYLQDVAATTHVLKPLISATFKLNSGVRHIEENSGANEQTNGIVRDANNVAGTITCKCRFDPQIETWYNEGGDPTTLFFASEIPYLDSDDGVDTRAIFASAPSCFIGAKPEVIDEGNLRVHQFELHLMMSTLPASTTAGTAASPFVLARF